MKRAQLKIYATLWLAAALAVAVVVWWLVGTLRKTELSLTVDQGINITPQQIASIKAIGEWEFLSVDDEELVDTVRRGFFSDDHLARIYYGTLRIGINLHDVEPGWLKASGDSVVARLPRVGLLDKDFIDEARTKNFFESGRWDGTAREALYMKAHRQMLVHGLTPQNLERARQNGEVQFRQMMKALGFPHVGIRWED